MSLTTSLVSGAKPRTPKGSSRTAQGASPGFKGQIAESPERAAQGVRSKCQINARHKAPLWYRDQLHRPFGASLVTVLVPRACALGFPESPLRGLASRQKLGYIVIASEPSYSPVTHGRDASATITSWPS